jgi:DNA/RNA endonuclease YhcR with UshA esterase domain
MKRLLAFAFLCLILTPGLRAQTPDKPLPPVIGTIAQPEKLKILLKAEEAKNHLGETVTVCGVVRDARFLESSATQPTLLNLGAAFPNQHLTIFISKEVRASLANQPEEFYQGKKVCVTGKVTEYRGKPQIVLVKKEDLKTE